MILTFMKEGGLPESSSTFLFHIKQAEEVASFSKHIF